VAGDPSPQAGDPTSAGRTIDLDALDLGHMARYARTATFAPNWWAVLLTDASVGLVVVILGVLVASLWIGWLGWIVILLGVLYMLMVGRRFLQWRWLRSKADL